MKSPSSQEKIVEFRRLHNIAICAREYARCSEVMAEALRRGKRAALNLGSHQAIAYHNLLDALGLLEQSEKRYWAWRKRALRELVGGLREGNNDA